MGLESTKFVRVELGRAQTPDSSKTQGVLDTLTSNWEGLGNAMQEALKKVGFKPPKKEVDSLLKALKEHKGLGISLTTEQTQLLHANSASQQLTVVPAPPGLGEGAAPPPSTAATEEGGDVTMQQKTPDNRVRSRTPPKK